MKITKLFLLAVFSSLLLGCTPKNETKGKITEEKIEESHHLLEDIELISIESGWYNLVYPQVNIKLKNISGKPINESVKLKYRFVDNDEVLDENSTFLHSFSDVDWDSDLIKNETIRSFNGYKYGWQGHNVKCKICFEDNSVIWEGEINNKAIF